MTNNERICLFAVKNNVQNPSLIREFTNLTTTQCARALSSLVDQGLITKRGRGIYIATVQASQPLIATGPAKPKHWFWRFFE